MKLVIEYAYPTSSTATKAGKGKTGCWVIDGGARQKSIPFDTLEDARNFVKTTFPTAIETPIFHTYQYTV